MSRYDHKIETSLEGIEHLSKEKITVIGMRMKRRYSPARNRRENPKGNKEIWESRELFKVVFMKLSSRDMKARSKD